MPKRTGRGRGGANALVVAAVVALSAGSTGCASRAGVPAGPSTSQGPATRGDVPSDARSPATQLTTAAQTTVAASTAGPVSTAGPSTAGPSTAAGPCGWRTGPTHYDHVVWVWMENKDTSAVFDSTKAPFLRQLGAECGTATSYVDEGVHPSLPNYIAATSGGPQGIGDDNPPSNHLLTDDNIFRQVRALGQTAKSYAETMPGPCTLTSAGRYAVKHNPAAYYVGGDDRAACQRDDVPFDQFAADLARDELPAFSFVIPNLCNDMHDCSVSTGDAWLRTFVSSIVDQPVYRTGTTAVFIVFDEGDGAGTMPFFAIGATVRPGIRANGTLNHASLLAFTEDALGINEHLGSAATAPSLSAAFGL